ncbi:hypothetical protein MBT84_44035 [Streptomyces sp. MBT84]|nr:hypothetical protein [Streptomyces sp. MBT84]
MGLQPQRALSCLLLLHPPRTPNRLEETPHAEFRQRIHPQTTGRRCTLTRGTRPGRRPDRRLPRSPRTVTGTRRRPVAVPGQACHRVLDRERNLPRKRGGRRQHRHPLVLGLLRPAVATGRPRVRPAAQPRHSELGGRLRDGLPDPDLHRRQHLDHRPLHHHRHRRNTEYRSHRQRPLRPHLRHRAGTPYGYSLWEFQVYGPGGTTTRRTTSGAVPATYLRRATPSR